MRTSILAISGVLFGGCTSNITGNEGNFQFSYVADDRITDFNKPVAVGAFLDLTVRDVGAQLPVTLSEASFDDEGVLKVDSFSGSEITVQGMGEGGALLSVAGITSGGEDLTDSVNMLSAVPEVLILRHTCDVTLDSAYYLVDQRVWVPFEMEKENGQPVIGYGYYPLTVDGGDSIAMNSDESGQQYMAFDTTTTPGTVTLTSDIDDTTLTLQVIEGGAIDGVMIPVAYVAEDIDVGDTNAFYVLPSVDGVPVCQAYTDVTMVSDTPDICTVTDRSADDSEDGQYEWGWFDVTGVSEGTCLYTVTYSEGNGGAGASAQFEYTVQP